MSNPCEMLFSQTKDQLDNEDEMSLYSLKMVETLSQG